MGKAAAQGFSAERLGRIDRFIEEKYIAPGRLPCAQLVIARRGEVVHETVLGQRDLERGLPCEADTIFRIYSMTKPITSVALMILVEEGKVALDDPVERHIPEWKDLGVYAAGNVGAFATTRPARPMQVVDLMRHTSGLTYGFQNRTMVDYAYRKTGVGEMGGQLTLEGFIDQLAKLPLEFSPGEAWNYSVSTDVVGYLVQKISGQPFQDFLKQRIFDPLGMNETGFEVPAGQEKRFSACYNITPKGGLKLQDDPTTSGYLAPPAFYSGGGGLVSTTADYLKFAQMLLNRGALNGVRLIAPKTLQLMASNHLPGDADLTQMSRSMFSESTNAGVGFGLGFAVVMDPPKTLIPCSKGEFYWGGAASTAFWVDPVEELTAVFMTQAMPSSGYPIRRELRTLVYAALEEPNG
ncbi:serine hydrolase domain-containing protein [Phenylobacterium sp.]|jgi:CubicO group peptidase (beta-lactamase class C family)|uniref:serine hydrolase domain-containing protein n=1 Tax=Phenylobacterium sp. TaxID=1871053 RepID=UPI002E303C52|nr:serine hydrolase domain-containing protein [Phenylobacterium sp.]HEX2560437.1 serine hydrolase domain-containing protein [Phenylobacterium sp.]